MELLLLLGIGVELKDKIVQQGFKEGYFGFVNKVGASNENLACGYQEIVLQGCREEYCEYGPATGIFVLDISCFR